MSKLVGWLGKGIWRKIDAKEMAGGASQKRRQQQFDIVIQVGREVKLQKENQTLSGQNFILLFLLLLLWTYCPEQPEQRWHIANVTKLPFPVQRLSYFPLMLTLAAS